ncbi:alpha/beta hydrolase [soil metagenome]
MSGVSRRRFLVSSAALVAAATTSGCGLFDDEEPEVVTRPYGDHPLQVGDLWVPVDTVAPRPVVVLIHGGYWQAGFNRSLMDDLARDLAGRGFAVWNVDYRVLGDGGGWPETFDDLGRGVDLLADLATERRLDLGRVVTVGHSAGGTLAVWAAARATIPAGSPGADPRVLPCAAVSLAGVLDLAECADQGRGSGACSAVMGGHPGEVAERYDTAAPLQLVPLGVPTLVAHGTADEVVPVSDAQRYAEAARAAGDAVELLVIEDVGHFELIEPDRPAWQAVADRLPALCP